LTAVIGALPVLRGEALLRIIPSNLEVTSSMKKQVNTQVTGHLQDGEGAEEFKKEGAIEGLSLL